MREQKEMMKVPKSSCNGGCESSHCVVKFIIINSLLHLFIFLPLTSKLTTFLYRPEGGFSYSRISYVTA